MSLETIFRELQSIFSDQLEIERKAIEALQNASFQDYKTDKHTSLPKELVNVMQEEQAHEICKSILKAELDWCPPKTSTDKLYIEHSKRKAHLEILGSNRLIKSYVVRIGLYDMLNHS